ncbi:WecB/TagA/CpsF family glycosyltransferase [Falsigemmobacter intermedius]|uniref:Glycosyltransferase n=1 Tax=Falsigemmobacter intermedius TaxID=1553448 RepID=A0A444MGS8_9RHOB|nr:WecB/TagA/CpsF family glycosyltransferase [Falsigemmobacter intermedius]RWY45532.1 glycosyltransferase [Falsigemmobacter intermedius]
MDFRIRDRRLRVNIPDRARLMAELRERMRQRRGFALATLNLDHLVKLRQDEAFLDAYLAQDLVVADGNPVVWLSRLAKKPVSLVPGSELVVPMAELARDSGLSIALFGSSDAALADAAQDLTRRLPGLQISARIAPPMGFDPQSPAADALLAEVRDSGAGLCFLALGAPRQEILAARARSIAPQTGFASIGAGLDFLGGHQKRAPVWVQKIAMEWLWRMLSSPRRLAGRYLRCALLLPELVADALRLRRGG